MSTGRTSRKTFPSTPYIRFDNCGGLRFTEFLKEGKCQLEYNPHENIFYKNPEFSSSSKEQTLNNIGWKFYCPGILNGSSTDSSNFYDLKFDTDETENLNEVYKKACDNLFKVLLELLIDQDQIRE